MIGAAFCIPGDLALPTGGYRYDRELLARMPAHGVDLRYVALPAAFPHPTEADLHASRAALEQARESGPLLVDGLALGAMPAALVRELKRPVVALVHHPLCLETGLHAEREAFLRRNEAEVLQLCPLILVTSRTTKRWLIDEFGLPADSITVAEPGVDRPNRAPARGNPPQLLAVGAVSDRKAYSLLVEALSTIRELDWRLTIAGSLTLSPMATSRLRDSIAASGCADRIKLTGAIGEADLAALYAGADLFVSASLHEGYGMALAEALAHGLPIVASSAGAADDLLPAAAAMKVGQGDAAGLTAALRNVLGDPALRQRLSDGAWEAGRKLPTWDAAAAIAADLLKAAARRWP